MTIINFKEHKFRKEGKYKCECGNKFKRVMKTSWTENPFNTLWREGKIDELNIKCKKELKESSRERNCPKCGLLCKIINN